MEKKLGDKGEIHWKLALRSLAEQEMKKIMNYGTFQQGDESFCKKICGKWWHQQWRQGPIKSSHGEDADY